MTVIGNSSPFGSSARTRSILALSLLGQSHARELARVLDAPLSSIQSALKSLERDGLVTARSRGRTRVFEINPGYFARRELLPFVTRLAEAESWLTDRVESLRRRPRRSGKPL